MNDSLALDIGAKLADQPSIIGSLIKPTLGATISARRKTGSRPNPPSNDAATSSSAHASIASRLRLGAPELLARASAATQGRFVDLVSRRLGGCLSNAMAIFRAHVGEVAALLDPEQRSRLQDLALTVRPRTDDLVPQAARSMSPSELVANLAAACEAHSPDGIDALRCRDLVYGGSDPLAREAMLDLACLGLPSRSQAMFEQLVADHMIGLFAATSLLTPGTIERLRACSVHHEEAEPSARMAPDGDLPVRDKLVQMLRQGRHQAAVALLASAAGVSRATVEAAICLRTAKGLVSLAWRAGLDPALSVTIQSALGRVPPDQILSPTQTGDFPLTGPEMLWQCRFLARSQSAFTAE